VTGEADGNEGSRTSTRTKRPDVSAKYVSAIYKCNVTVGGGRARRLCAALDRDRLTRARNRIRCPMRKGKLARLEVTPSRVCVKKMLMSAIPIERS
jgi:hypothetical protein